MALILQGTSIRDSVREQLKQTIENLSIKPTLAIIQVGNRPDSNSYINQKKQFGEAIGAKVIHENFEEFVTEERMLKKIHEYNQDTTIHGIIVQLPLPPHISKETVIEALDPAKDIDGLTAYNTKLLFDGVTGGYIPATSRGIISILSHYNIPLSGKHVVIVGRSTLVGKPTALAFLKEDATITIAHKETADLASITKRADILVVAIGDPEFITSDYLSPGQIIIDVGINVIGGEKRRLIGDVNFKDAEPVVAAITPVPGGVGPMTVTSLFQNLIDAYHKLEK